MKEQGPHGALKISFTKTLVVPKLCIRERDLRRDVQRGHKGQDFRGSLLPKQKVGRFGRKGISFSRFRPGLEAARAGRTRRRSVMIVSSAKCRPPAALAVSAGGYGNAYIAHRTKDCSKCVMPLPFGA